MEKDRTYSIGDVSKLTGITKRQLRNWESVGHILPPIRIIYGERQYRRFSEEDLSLIRAIKANLDQGYTLKAAVARATKK
jgi:DNA-binding transcriptional MerR regulator